MDKATPGQEFATEKIPDEQEERLYTNGDEEDFRPLILRQQRTRGIIALAQ